MYYVVYYNGFSNASRNLNIAQSALSYNIKQLEIQLNTKLIDRSNKNFQLTDDGNNLFESIRNMFENLDRNLEQYHTIKDELVIGIRHYLSDFIFKDVINCFIKKYPNIHLVIKLYSKLDLNKFEDDYDILIDYEDYTNLINTNNKLKICSLENIFVAGNKLAEMLEDVHNMSDLSDVNFISMCPNKKNGKLQKMCFDNNMLFNNIITINNSILCKKLIKDNVGLCLINKTTVKEELDCGDIYEVKITEYIFSDNIILVYKSKQNTNKFIDEIKKVYKENENE